MDLSQDRPAVIAPPPLIYAGALVLSLVIHYLTSPHSIYLPKALTYPLGGLLILAGAAIALAASRGFQKARTDVRPWKPTTAIVASGPYRFTRNPMYVGMTAAYLGIALVANCPLALLLVIPVILTIHFGVVRPEEAYLEAKFGEDYLALKRQTRRWL